MRGHNFLDPELLGNPGDVLRVGMAPVVAADVTEFLAFVLVLRVLAVGEPQIGSLHQLLEAFGDTAPHRLVVGGEDEHLALVLDPVPVRFLRMEQLPTEDLHRVSSFAERDRHPVEDGVEIHPHAGLFDFLVDHREHRAVHLTAEHVLERAVPLLTAVELESVVELAPVHVERSEERIALDVIPVHVALQERSLDAPLLLGEHFSDEGITERTHARPHVEDDQLVAAAHFHAGGVATHRGAFRELEMLLDPERLFHGVTLGERADERRLRERCLHLLGHICPNERGGKRTSHAPRLDLDVFHD